MSIINEALKKAQNNLSKQGQDKLLDKGKTEKIQSNQSSVEYLQKVTAQPVAAKKRNSNKIILIISLFFIFIGTLLSILFVLMKKSVPNKEIPMRQTPSSSKIIPTIPISTPMPTPQPIALQPVTPKIFKKGQFVLSGITFVDEKAMAIINDEIYEENDFVDGHKILKIEKKSVSLASPEGKIIILTVKK